MDRVAVFVDAGYLFAQGSAAITGSKKSRHLLQLNNAPLLARLRTLAAQKATNSSLLRIYWYDGALGNHGPTAEQASLAHSDDVKLRLGFVNSNGQQKGVDSLIVTDLVELARNKAISDAVLLSGDEDVRIGVQLAQTFGVRVHLIGIVPCRGSQSQQLMQEADTTEEWDIQTITSFLTVQSKGTPMSEASFTVGKPPQPEHIPLEAPASFQEEVRSFISDLSEDQIRSALTFWESGNKGNPPEFDGRLLARCRDAIGRDLDTTEKRSLRSLFKAAITKDHKSVGSVCSKSFGEKPV